MDCRLPAVWNAWSTKFHPDNFTAADGGWSKAMGYYMNVSKIEHWVDECAPACLLDCAGTPAS